MTLGISKVGSNLKYKVTQQKSGGRSPFQKSQACHHLHDNQTTFEGKVLGTSPPRGSNNCPQPSLILVTLVILVRDHWKGKGRAEMENRGL